MERFSKNVLIGDNLISSCKKHIKGHYFPHFHDFYEIEYVICGNGSYTINGSDTAYSNGMLFFMTPLDYHSVQTENTELFNIMFSEQLVEFKQLEPFLRYSAPRAIMIEPENREFFQLLFTEIVENRENTEYCGILMCCVLCKLIQLLPKQGNSNLSGVMTKLHSYIINNYRTSITLDTAAAHVGLTPSYASALFKKEMKIGFKSYLNSLRLEYAKKLLIYTEQPIKQICEESGFEDVPNFIKCFKVYYGMTPTVLRNKMGCPEKKNIQ